MAHDRFYGICENKCLVEIEHDSIPGVVPVKKGGTGATIASTARTNLGVTGTVLYDNSAGSGGTTTLSSSAANFDYLVFYFTGAEKSKLGSAKVYNANGKTATLAINDAIVGTSAGWQCCVSQVVISGTTITKPNTCQVFMKTSDSNPGVNNGGGVYIRRIEGWNI